MARVEAISSPANPLLKSVRRAILRGGLTDEGLAVAESFHLLEEALRSECAVETVLASTSVRSTVESHVRGLSRVRVTAVEDALFQKIAGTETTQGVIALVRPPTWDIDQLFRGRNLMIVLDGLQDPGNAGAIARSSEAFGATALVFLKGTVSPFHPKTLRASAGSLFRLPFAYGIDTALLLAAMKQRKIDLYSAVAHAQDSCSPSGLDLTRRCAFLIGSEGRGVSRELRSAALDVSIPTAGVESLNAAIAASILLYEASRQRSLHP